MRRFLSLMLLLVATDSTVRAQAVEPHLREPGSSAIFLRSAFAHGYRHGYEEGYHQGNMDINLGRLEKTRLSQFHGLALGYAPEFGPKKPFQQGFGGGLTAGYSDGYAGRTFRAVGDLRRIAATLSADQPPPADPRDSYFDGGFASGYGDGLHRDLQDDADAGAGAGSENASRSAGADCVPVPHSDPPARQTFCEGYRLGYALGSADGEARRPEHRSIQASRSALE